MPPSSSAAYGSQSASADTSESLLERTLQRPAIFQALEQINYCKDQSSITDNGSLRAADLTGWVPFILRVLPYLPFITILRLCIMQYNSIDMGHIFQTCPRLQSLQLDSPSTLYLQGNWVGSSNNNKTGSSVPLLRSLYLENACFSQPRIPASGSSAIYADKILEKATFIHFSDLGQQPTDDAQEAQQNVLMIFPHATECSFWTSNLTPILRQCLQKLPNVVTTQNLVTKSVNQPNKGLALHQFLCESPHLLHLKDSQSFAWSREWIPLIDGCPYPDTERMPTVNQASGWCRQLQTLHIEFHNLGPPDRQLSSTRCRVLFGYTSRLAGGLCLLASLRLPESFCIGFDKNPQILKPRDARWLTKSGRSATSKQERRRGMGSWPGAVVKERPRANNQWERISRGGAPKFVPPQGVEPELLEGLKNLGLLEDVKLMLGQMKSNAGYDRLPQLRSLSVYSDGETGLSPENEYLRMNIKALANESMIYDGYSESPRYTNKTRSSNALPYGSLTRCSFPSFPKPQYEL
ncbi:hypothetical protein BGZ89_001325 [Linnemannia elongata]|nr:hypothetical protein BGZ89_001325 [Linnemannia elongata]